MVRIEVPLCPCCLNSFKPLKGVDFYCDRCETLFTPYIEPSIYGRSYYLKYIEYGSSDLNGKIQKVRWDAVTRHCSEGKLLDIGCGVGSFMKSAPSGFSVSGQDINAVCVDHCVNAGMTVSTELPTHQIYDVITMFDVLEHIPDLPNMIKKIMSLLCSKGLWVISTPNFYKERIKNIEEWTHYKPNEHIYYLSTNSIFSMCDTYKFHILEIGYDESKYRPPMDNIATYVLRKI